MPQALSNIMYGHMHAQLQARGTFIIYTAAMNELSTFKPQCLSNIVWSYATAGHV
jgi:hypothetical protein